MGFYRIDQLPQARPAPGIVQRLLHGDNMSVIFFTLEKDARVPEHSHPHEQVGTVIRGRLSVTVGGETKTVGPGDVYHVASDVRHSGVGLEEDTFVMECFSPARDDLK